MTGDLGKLVGGAVAVLVGTGIIALAIRQDRYERALLAGGDCTLVMETLHTPPPVAHTSCVGEQSRSCTTWYSQPAPYLRSLWRCPDPERAGAQVEFWRRSAERGTW